MIQNQLHNAEHSDTLLMDAYSAKKEAAKH